MRANKPKALSVGTTAPSPGRIPEARTVQFCLTKLHLARTRRDLFWRTMNNFGSFCATLKQSDSF